MGSLTIFTQVADYLKQNKVTLVAVSKTQSNEAIMDRYNLGQRIFGENRVQELVAKQLELPKDIQWHMIGHLQRNKVKYIVPFVSLIHSVDSIKLMEEIDKRAKKVGRVIDCLLEIQIAQEQSKFGLSFEEAEKIFDKEIYQNYSNINIRGFMGMATFTDDHAQIRREFRALKKFFDKIKKTYLNSKKDFDLLSMGMSGDYKIAIEEGSNIIRIGTSIFGQRIY